MNISVDIENRCSKSKFKLLSKILKPIEELNVDLFINKKFVSYLLTTLVFFKYFIDFNSIKRM